MYTLSKKLFWDKLYGIEALSGNVYYTWTLDSSYSKYSIVDIVNIVDIVDIVV